MKRALLIAAAAALMVALGVATALAARSASPAQVDFGTLVQGESDTQRRDVTYAQTAGELGGSFSSTIANDNSGGNIEWQTGNGTCPVTIPAGAFSCSVPVTVGNSSQATGGFTATLRITVGGSPLDVPLRVRYVDPGGGKGGPAAGGKKAKKKCKKPKKGKGSASAAKKKKCKKGKKGR